jgi:hypothetical protein
MSSYTAAERRSFTLGTTTSGLASANQLVDVTSLNAITLDQSANPYLLTLVGAPIITTHSAKPLGRPYLTAEEDPVLAKLWDNDADAVYDSM